MEENNLDSGFIGIPNACLKLCIGRNRLLNVCHSHNIKIYYKFYTKQFIYLSDFNKIEKIIEKDNLKNIEKKKYNRIDASNEEIKNRIEKAREFKYKNYGLDLHFMKELENEKDI